MKDEYGKINIYEKSVRFVLGHTVCFAAIPNSFWNTGFQENEINSDEDVMCDGSDYEPDVDMFKPDKSKPVKLHRLAQVCYC